MSCLKRSKSLFESASTCLVTPARYPKGNASRAKQRGSPWFFLSSGSFGKKLLLGGFSQIIATQLLEIASHFVCNCGVFMRQGRHDFRRCLITHNAYPEAAKSKSTFFQSPGFFGIREINGDNVADRRCHLVHQSAGFAEIFIFGKLSNLGDLYCVGGAVIVAFAQNSTYQHLECGGGGKPRFSVRWRWYRLESHRFDNQSL